MAYKLSEYVAALKQLINDSTSGVDIGKARSGSTVPAYVSFTDSAGTVRYTWYDTTGNLRVSTTEPTAFTDGSILSSADATQQVDVTLTSAQLLALNATPISVLAAPGANKAYIILGVVATKIAGTAYAGIDVNEDITLKYTNGSGATLCTIETTGFLDQTTAQSRHSYPSSWTTNAASALLAITPVANAAVVAYMTTAEITTGDTDLKLRIYYKVIPTVL